MIKNPEKGKYLSPNGSRTWEYLATLSCSLNAFCIGIVIGWMSPSLMKFHEPDSPIKLTTDGSSSVIAAMAIGHAAGPFLSNPLIDRIGRKNTIFIGGIPLIINWAMILIPNHLLVLIIARFLAGVALGITICAVPLYLGEIASVNSRGTISSSMSVMSNIGILFAYIIVPYLTIIMTGLIFLSISIIVQITLWLIPESPYYLSLIGRNEEAEETLVKLRGKHDVTDEFEQIKLSVVDSTSNKISTLNSLKNLFTIKKNFRALITIVLFSMTHHLGGLAILIIFSHRIFKDADSILSNNHASLFIAITKLISALVSAFLVDRTGRKPLIFVGGLIATISNFVIGGFFYAKEFMHLDVSYYSIVPLIAAMTLVFAFNIGLVSIQTVFMGELFSTDVKAMGSCAISFFGGVLGAITGKMYLIVVDSWGFGHSIPFIGSGCLLLMSTITILSIVPETKGKTFLEIQQILAK